MGFVPSFFCIFHASSSSVGLLRDLGSVVSNCTRVVSVGLRTIMMTMTMRRGSLVRNEGGDKCVDILFDDYDFYKDVDDDDDDDDNDNDDDDDGDDDDNGEREVC